MEHFLKDTKNSAKLSTDDSFSIFKEPTLYGPQRFSSRHNLIQRKAYHTGKEDTAYIQRTASAGVQGTGNKLPYLDLVQSAFGQHDLSHVQAYTGSRAKQASENIGAEAYATGSKVAFAESNPSLHTVAHEAAHIVQQQAGVQLKCGVGQVGDHYERQADQVADAVVQGKSVESMLTSVNSAFPVSTVIQRKLAIDNSGREELLASSNLDAHASQLKLTLNIDENLIKEYLVEIDDITYRAIYTFTMDEIKKYLTSRHALGDKFKNISNKEEKYTLS